MAKPGKTDLAKTPLPSGWLSRGKVPEKMITRSWLSRLFRDRRQAVGAVYLHIDDHGLQANHGQIDLRSNLLCC